MLQPTDKTVEEPTTPSYRGRNSGAAYRRLSPIKFTVPWGANETLWMGDCPCCCPGHTGRGPVDDKPGCADGGRFDRSGGDRKCDGGRRQWNRRPGAGGDQALPI